MGVAKALQDYDRPLETVFPLKYLGCLLTATDGDCPTIISNLGKAIKIWSWLARILGQEGPQVLQWQHSFQWRVIILERLSYPHPSLLLRQTPSLPDTPPCIEIR